MMCQYLYGILYSQTCIEPLPRSIFRFSQPLVSGKYFNPTSFVSKTILLIHSSEIRGFYSTKCSNETRCSFFSSFFIFIYVNTDQVIHKHEKYNVEIRRNNENRKNQQQLIQIIWYKFWSVLLEHFVGHKSLINEELYK